MYGILNVLSLILGLLSWILSIAALWRRSPKACATIEDTNGAVTLAAAVLLAGDILLNLPVLVNRR